MSKCSVRLDPVRLDPFRFDAPGITNANYIQKWYVCRDCGLVDNTPDAHIHHNGKWDVFTSRFEADSHSYMIKLTGTQFADNQYKTLVHTTYTKETPMASLADKLTELRMSEPDKTLYKHGIIDKNGNLTDEGGNIVKQYAFELIKDALVKDLAKLDADKKS